MSTLKCGVPALAFTIQSNLLFVATANLETPTFQVTYQTTTLFTALFSVLLLGRRLALSQWLSLALLFAGTVLASDIDQARAQGREPRGCLDALPVGGHVAVEAVQEGMVPCSRS